MSESCSTIPWTERIIRRVAGVLVLASVILAWQVHIGWLGLGAFVGLNLFQSSFTNFCPLEKILNKFEGRAQAAGSSH